MAPGGEGQALFGRTAVSVISSSLKAPVPSLDYACPTCRAAGTLIPTPSPRRDAKVYRCRECDLLTTEPHRLIWAVYLDGELDWLSWFAFEAERQVSPDHWRVKRSDTAEMRPVYDGQTVAPGGRWKGGPADQFLPLLERLTAGGGRGRRDDNLNAPDVSPYETAERVRWITQNWHEPKLLNELALHVAELPTSHIRTLPPRSLRLLAPALLQSEDDETRLFAQRWLGRSGPPSDVYST